MGLKRVRMRRADALAGEAWDSVERMLADHYRREGYAVEHCGTGGRQGRFDGGVDLRMRRAGATIVVQCKHWNAYQVTHNAVHELLGIMVNERADGAILVTSGEFTGAAIEAASRHGHVQLVDGDELRTMLGQLASAAGTFDGQPRASQSSWREPATGFGRYAAERLVSAAEDRLRGGGSRPASFASDLLWTGFMAGALKLVVAIALLWFLGNQFQRIIGNLATSVPAPVSVNTRDAAPRSVPGHAATRVSSPPPPPVIRESSPADMERWRQRNAESMRILEATTPELPEDPRRRAPL